MSMMAAGFYGPKIVTSMKFDGVAGRRYTTSPRAICAVRRMATISGRE
jgi:hypothetical protein